MQSKWFFNKSRILRAYHQNIKEFKYIWATILLIKRNKTKKISPHRRTDTRTINLPIPKHRGEAPAEWNVSELVLDYASYVILERAVPHINDGLKPVQRRILHSMKRLDDGRYNKVANIVGHTMQFHPHGDASIGDALVQLGQKDLLIDCQGNWGNILTGDGAAAPVISKHVYPNLHWTWFSIPKPPNGKRHTTDETKSRSPYLSNSRSCSLRE